MLRIVIPFLTVLNSEVFFMNLTDSRIYILVVCHVRIFHKVFKFFSALHRLEEKEREILLKKHVLGITVLLVMAMSLLGSIRIAKSQNPVIKIGIFGPSGIPGYPHWDAGMWSAAQMLAEQYNNAGGWNIGGTNYDIEVYAASEYTEDPSNVDGIHASIDYLCKPPPDGVGVNFIIGGFRTECVEVAIDYWYEQGYSEDVPFFINGAATDDLIGDTVGTNHEGYKHLYRVMPVNSSALFSTFGAAIQYVLCSENGILTRLFGKTWWPGQLHPQVKVAVITEDLAWTVTMHYYLTTPGVYPLVLGNYVNVTYATRLPDGNTIPANPEDFENALLAANATGANLLIHVFSGSAGQLLITKWHDLQLPMLPVGINVVSQTQGMWSSTAGACEYESHLMALGTRTAITPELEKFWDDFLAWTEDHLGQPLWPVYTAVGVANTFIVLKNATETLGTLDINDIHDYLCPRTSPGRAIQVLNGIVRFTADHDVYLTPLEYSPYWTGYVRALVVQWLDVRLEAVYPIDASWSKVWCLPPWMYTLIWDITYDAYVGIDDIVGAAENFGAEPGHPRWDHRSDVTFDDYVGIDDVVGIAEHFGSGWTPPP